MGEETEKLVGENLEKILSTDINDLENNGMIVPAWKSLNLMDKFNEKLHLEPNIAQCVANISLENVHSSWRREKIYELINSILVSEGYDYLGREKGQNGKELGSRIYRSEEHNLFVDIIRVIEKNYAEIYACAWRPKN